MPAPHLIPARPGTVSPTPSRGRERSLPPDLLREATQRIGILSLLSAALWTLGTIFGHLTLRAQRGPDDTRWLSFLVPIDAIALLAVVGSLAIWAYTRRATNTQRSLDVGLAYMIAMSFALGVMFHVGMMFYVDPTQMGQMGASRAVVPEISWIGAVVLIYAAIVPTPPRKLVIAALIAVSMNPVGMLIARSGGAWDFGASSNVLLMHYPDYLLVGAAGVIAHVVTQLGRQVTRAREMGSYRLGELLGSGGMGEVYKATHTMLARPAAVKLIRPEALGNGDAESAQLAMRRFTREAEAAANLRSPHTVEVYDFGVTEDQTLYYVMEMLEGMDLESLVRQHGALTPGRAIYILRQVCESLAEAHERGLVHRDIKPANIHVGRVALKYDFVKVLDFGLVKEVKRPTSQDTLVTAQGMAIGTPSYMAPEVALGEDVDRRADIYALGCVAFYLLTGRLVFEADNPMRVLVKHIEEQPRAPSSKTDRPIPASLDNVVLACLMKDPAARTPSAPALADALLGVERDVEGWDESKAANWWKTRS